MRAGHRMTDGDLTRVREHLCRSATPSAESPTVLPPMHLGMVLPYDVYDRQGVLLLTSGSLVTQRFLRHVQFRNVRLGSADAPPRPVRVLQGEPRTFPAPRRAPRRPEQIPARELETDTTIQLDQMLDEVGLPDAARPQPAKSSGNLPRLTLPRLREQVEIATGYFQDAVDQYAHVAIDIQRGRSLHLGSANVLISQLMSMIRLDQSLAMLVMDLKSSPHEYLYQHGVNVAMLSMRVAMQMGYERELVLETALAALFADLGMLSVPESIRFAPRPLTDQERAEVQRHPIYSVDRLERSGALRPTGLLIAYQSHERIDKSGYPRRRDGMFIHPLSQVVSAADMYCAMTCDRPHRPGCTPYAAISALLKQVQTGQLDRNVVRHMLRCVSVFPVGSYVRLSDNCIARVLRANAEHPKHPIVVPLEPDGAESSHEMDLTRSGTPHITAVLNAREIPGDKSLPQQRYR